MNVLVTGATGFLGAEIVGCLLRSAGRRVEAWGHTAANVEALRSRFSEGADRLVVRTGDLLDPPRIASSIDVVIHAAAVRPDGMPHARSEFDRLNAKGTQRVIDRATSAGCDRFLYVSSQSVYGDSEPPWTEDSPIDPQTAYAKSKRDGEIRVLGSAIACRGVVRLSRLYGVSPSTRWDELPGRFARSVFRGEPLVMHGDGTQRIDLLHVRDAAEAIVALVDADRLPAPFVFNVGGGGSHSLNEFSEIFARLAPRYGLPKVRVMFQLERRPRGGSHLELCTGLIERTVGWRPRIALDDGVGEYLEALAGER